MTINIVIHCRDGIVLACDSLASQIETVLIPNSAQPVVDPNTGKPLINPQTQTPVVDANSLQRRETIINVFGNVNKLFQIKDYPIGVVISGLGQIGESTFDDIFYDFDNSLTPMKDIAGQTLIVSDIVNRLLNFLKEKYFAVFQERLDHTRNGPPLKLLIGGYGSNQRRGEIYEIAFPSGILKSKNDIVKNPYTMVIGGQLDAIQRFISGYSNEMVDYVVDRVCSQWKKKTIDAINKNTSALIEYLKSNDIQISQSVISNLPNMILVDTSIELPLPQMTYNIELKHMSLQDTVDFAMFLTTITYGRQRFVSGIPTVGGKVNLATITIKDGFKLLTPKEISVPTINI